MDSEPQITEEELMKMSLDKQQPETQGDDPTVTPSQLIVDAETKKKRKRNRNRKKKNKDAGGDGEDDGGDGGDPAEGDDDDQIQETADGDGGDGEGGDTAGGSGQKKKGKAKKVEEQKQSEIEGQEGQFNPVDAVKEACLECGMDWRSPDFNEKEMLVRFQSIVDDKQVHFQQRDKYEHIIKILGEHKFWNTQAIVTARTKLAKKGEIKHFNKNDIPKDPLPLPDGFEWSSFDIEDDAQVEELKKFLENHYVEDNVGNFRLKYSADKLRWGIQMPGYIKDLHFLVRSTQKKNILASLIGVPKTYIICGQKVRMLEVNFLAVHQKVRAKRLAQIVIQEMMRRKRLYGFPQAFYTSGHSMPTPFTTCHYMNRFINGETLVLTKYTNCPADMSLKEFDRKYRLPKKETIKLVGKVRPMEKRDVPTVFKLFRDQQAKYKIQYKYNQDEIIHHLLPKEDIVWTYVVEDIIEGKKVVTDFFSMYRLTQTCTNADVIALGYNQMHSACMYFYGLTQNSLKDVVLTMLHLAKEEMACDAFSAMTLMDNTPDLFLKELNFLPGDGCLYYYLVNWSLGDETIESNDLGTILV